MDLQAALKIVALLVALEHTWFLVLEMFLWTKPLGRKTFGNSAEFAEQSKVLAANQGLYNGFLVAGLLWGVLHPSADVGLQLMTFFLTLVVVAGVYGGVTVSRRILVLQGAPAAVGLVLALWLWLR